MSIRRGSPNGRPVPRSSRRFTVPQTSPAAPFVSRRSPGAARTTVEGRQAQPPDDDDRGLPKGLGLLGKLVEAAILSPREGQKELGRLKALIESDLRA
jgi:hypothetical protein